MDPAHDRDRHRAVLAHHQLGGGGQLVGDTDLGHRQLATQRVGAAAQVDNRRHPRGSDGHVCDASAPGTPEGVRHHHADLDASARTQGVPDVPRGAVRVHWEQGGPPALDVGQVHAGIGAHEPLPGLGHEQLTPAPKDACRFAEDDRLVRQGVFGIDCLQTALGFGDHLLGDDDDIAVGQRDVFDDQFREFVAGLNLRDAMDRDQGDGGAGRGRGHAAAPVGSSTTRASAAASSGPRITVGVTTQRMPTAST